MDTDETQMSKPSSPRALTPSVAVLRPASTVVVLREAAAGLEVLMVRRSDQVAFMAGAYVFPGGRVDEGDAAGLQGLEAWTLKGGKPRFADLDAASEWAFRRAAARELLEEASVRVAAGSLEPFAHWVTPEIEIRRYDTRFFLTRMPGNQDARHDASETTALQWVTPAGAIEQCLRREILLPPPTWTTLSQLAHRGSVDEALVWARSRTIVRVEPGFIQGDGPAMLTLPGDPLFPTVPGWEVPDETRFVLQEGNRWLPQKP